MPNQPKTPGHTVRIPDDEWIPAKDKAAKEGETMTDVIRRALRRYVVGTVIAVTVLALADCGGAPTVKGVDYTSAESIVTALNTGGFECTGWTPNDGVIGAREDGWCTHGDGTVSVSTFDSALFRCFMRTCIVILKTPGCAELRAGDFDNIAVRNTDKPVALPKFRAVADTRFEFSLD